MIPQARFVSRYYGDESTLIIGSRLKTNTFIKPGMVYQLDLCLGEPIFREVGPIFNGKRENIAIMNNYTLTQEEADWLFRDAEVGEEYTQNL